MYRLLTRQGYMFPEISVSEAAVLNPTESLQSAAELEKEERDAQEAKLQELIRRGKPADLQEANRLMKVMAGFQGDKKNEYRETVAKEVDKFRLKAELLDEMLANTSPGEDIPDDDVFSDIVSSLKTSVPKLKALAEEESDDQNAVSNLLALNDYTHSLLEKYMYLKQKDIEKANSIVIARPPDVQITKGLSAPSDKLVSLIDFDDEPSSAQQSSSPNTTNSHQRSSSLDLLSELGGLTLGGSVGNNSSSADNHKSNQDILATFGSSLSQPAQPLFSHSASNSFSNPQIVSTDQHAPSTDNIVPPASSNADDWTFVSSSSSVPGSLAYPSLFTLLEDGTLSVTGTVARDPLSSTQLSVSLSFSNKSASSAISSLNIQLAVKRGLHLKVDPLSSTVLSQMALNGVHQNTKIEGVDANDPVSVKLRWIVTYSINGSTVEKDGISSLPTV